MRLQIIPITNNLQRYFFNTAWIMGERFFRMLVVFLVGIFVARYLGPKKLGILNYAISFVGLFTELATLGLDRISVRELVKSNYSKDTLLGTLFWLRLIGATLILLLIGIIINFMPDDPSTKIIVLLISTTLLLQPFNVIDFYFQAKVLLKFVVFARTFQLIITSICKIAFVLIKAPLMWFAIVSIIDVLSLSMGLIFFFIRTSPHLATLTVLKKFNHQLACNLLKESWPLIISGIVVSVYMKIDQVMLKEMLNSTAVGLYSVAVRLSETWYFIPALLLQSVFPAIVSLREKKSAYYTVRLQQLHDLLTTLAFIIAIFMTLFAREIIEFLFGPQFNESAMILMVHIWSGLFIFPGNIRANLIILEKKQKVALIFRTIGAILNIILNLILIPKYGPIGAAWATLISYALPVYLVSFIDPLIKETIIMTLKSYVLPLRLILYGKAIYETERI